MPKTVSMSIGWLGAVLCTLGYLLVSIKVIRAESLAFQLLNIFGGFCLSVTAIEASDLPNAAANLLWMLIGLVTLGRLFWNRGTSKQ
jgi:uncharacterized protein with PQ loop repeat